MYLPTLVMFGVRTAIHVLVKYLCTFISYTVFGIGSMIYSGIEIGMFFELNLDEEADCKNLFSVLRPVLQMTFVFVQMYFIFLNQKARKDLPKNSNFGGFTKLSFLPFPSSPLLTDEHLQE